MVGGSRIRQIGWALVLGICFALLLALTFKVNAVKSDVRLAERQIIAAQQAKLMLDTEFETRASQQQLSDWNAVEFGYAAPRADQYLESERQLAVLGTPRGIDAPDPVRVALNRPAPESESLFAEWMDDEGADSAARPERRELAAAGGLAERLASPAVGMAAVAEVSQ
ncbi:hypothetical protein [Qipengyuania profunda]|jgi:hypothetical protein|uniref:hypothetical protein n=1 Tax=Qipengyuania profunda TaxID=3113984 RepID=UPI002A187D0F|nr:hypothetical protein [Qipengyuania sp. HL-TH1]WPL56534.1 hypothetical protein SD421_13960 [Qipengyuania sp. HL-TH5]